MKTFLVRALSFILLMLSLRAGAQESLSGGKVVEGFRDNVVSISAKYDDGSQRDGFGFIIGERDGDIFIITAMHVVLVNDVPDANAPTINIRYFTRRSEAYSALLLETTNSDLDLAVLRAPAPGGLPWRRDALGTLPSPEEARGTEVWFVGRRTAWYVPTRPGIVNDVDPVDHTIVIDDLPVQVGTSGAPLIAANGLIGMIIEDTGAEARATAIDAIGNMMQRWGHPWQLLPYGTAIVTSGTAEVRDGFRAYGESGFSFSAAEVVPWNSDIGDILVSNQADPNRQPLASFFLPRDSPPYNAPQDELAKAGIISVKAESLDDVRECPNKGYRYAWFAAQKRAIYCVLTRDGAHYAKIKVTEITDETIVFDWIYQPDGSPKFR
jgi:hypothetical protein